MGIPLGDAAVPKKTPVVTLAIIVLNIAAYALTCYENLFLEVGDYWVSFGGFIPSSITNFFQWYRIFTSMFLHADFFHILFNTFFLYLFGRAVESVLGGLRFLAIYLVSGVAASVFHTAFSFLGGSTAYLIPSIGASGAISGVLGAYLILYPGTSLFVGGFFFMFPTFFRVKASYYLLFWFATQLIYGYAKAAGSTAVFAHAGGFVAGIALLALVVDKKRIRQFKLARGLGFPPYTTFTPIKTGGLSRTTKAVIAALLASLLMGTAYASIGLTNQSMIKSATIQYTCEGTLYVDYVGFQLPNIESQLSSISLDTTRILLSRLYAAGLLYNEAEVGKYINLSSQNYKLQLNIGGRRVDVDLALDYFKGEYDGDGFLSYGEGNLKTQVIVIYQYGVFLNGQIDYNFQLTSQTVNLTRVAQYTAAPSGVATIAALVVVLKKDKELALIGEESETVRRHFDLAI
jgi:membrane associated rhomboid family serine protease